MKAITVTLRGLLWIIVLLLMPTGLLAQVDGDSAQADRFSKEELTQMLAPIALYPDSLVAQVLMASTYPLEVVEAERWLQQHKELKGEELDNALKQKKWDPSVKSLCHTPDILIAMSEKLDQTRKLGDAFLSQEEDVMATIQELRKKAQDQGNLKTTREQKVIVEEEYVRIEPADPEVVYVPVYDPYYVYGPWWYPAYPPYYWYWPPGFVTGAYIGFGPRIYIGFDLFSWVWFDWGYRRIYTDYRHTHRFHRYPAVRSYDRTVWRHDPVHRRGVAYRDRRTSEAFGTRPRQVSPTRSEMRGYPTPRTEQRDVRPSQSTGDRRDRGIEPRQRQERNVPQGTMERRERIDTPRLRPDDQGARSPVRRDTPFRGIGEGSFERRAVERGGSSIRSSQPRSFGGDSRGGELRQRGGDFRGGGHGGGSRR